MRGVTVKTMPTSSKEYVKVRLPLTSSRVLVIYGTLWLMLMVPCTLFDVNYQPKRMSVEELENGLKWLFKETYSREETLRRVRSFARQRSLI